MSGHGFLEAKTSCPKFGENGFKTMCDSLGRKRDLGRSWQSVGGQHHRPCLFILHGCIEHFKLAPFPNRVLTSFYEEHSNFQASSLGQGEGRGFAGKTTFGVTKFKPQVPYPPARKTASSQPNWLRATGCEQLRTTQISIMRIRLAHLQNWPILPFRKMGTPFVWLTKF